MAMGLFSGYSFFEMYSNDKIATKNFILIFLCPVSLFMAFYIVFRYIKNAPMISVDKTKIEFNDETFYWDNLDKIELTGKKSFKFIFNVPMEGSMLQFKDGTLKYFFDDMYSNTWQIKSFIQQIIINKQQNPEIPTYKVDKEEISNEDFENFKGNQFTSLRGITFWGMLGFFLLLISTGNNTPTTGFLIFFGTIGMILFLFNSYLMHYFSLSDRYFVIRNHNYLWMRKIYRNKDIKEIVFETRDKMPNCLRIITDDFRNKIYPAATLRDKTWLNLKTKLEAKGIIVRNECIY
jgi:hypothetical protein